MTDFRPPNETCLGCEGAPAANNSPCAVCGQLTQPEPQGSMDKDQALIYAGYMADLALGLVGGQGLNGTVYPVHPDNFSDLAKKLRHAAEQYNNHILAMYRRLND